VCNRRLALLLVVVVTGAALRAQSTDGMTPLHQAVEANDLTAVRKLLADGPSAMRNVNTATRYGVTPLALAAINGDPAIVSHLLKAGANPNAALPDGETVLMTAARTGRADVIDALVKAGADVQARESAKGQTALMWAAADNNADAIKALVAAGAKLDDRSKGGFTPYLFAVRGGHLAAVRALLELGANVNEALPDGTSALLVAVINAHYELAAALLDRGADPNSDAQGWSALHQVAWSRRHNAGFNLPGPVATGGLDSLDLVRKLVAKGANINARQKKEPRDGNRNMLNRIGSTPFLSAAKLDDVPLMKVLLELGADPAITTEQGTTALMVAAGVGIWAPGENPGTHEEALAAVKLALEAGGGKVNDIDKNGETALHGAVYRGGAIPVIQYLADQGAKLDIRNKKGWLPVTAADGVEYTPAVLKRYPEAAALLRKLMKDRGLPVPESTQPGAGLLAAAAPETPAPAPAAPAQTGKPRTIWDGVFTDAQAARGESHYRASCSKCHSDDLMGDREAPALVGPRFAERWKGVTAADMLQDTRRTMPQEAPDSLGLPAYVDLVAFMLKSNGSPSGAIELPVDEQLLKQIQVTSR
jgi:ankyrin repeat protein